MNWWRRNSAIMFDLGATGLRAAQLTRRGRRGALRESFELDLSQVEESDWTERLPEVAARLAHCVHAGRFAGRSVGLTLHPPTIAFHPLKAPDALLQQPAQRVREALAWELAREFRVEPATLEVRYWKLPPGHRENLNLMSVYLQTETAQGLVDACAVHGLQLTRLEAGPCAVARTCLDLHAAADSDIWAVVDIGHAATCVTTLLGETPVYIRTLPIGAAHWIEQLTETLGLRPDAAARALREHGLGPLTRGTRSRGAAEHIPPADVPQVMSAALTESLAALQMNVRMCLSYVEDNYPSGKPARVFLAGRGGGLGGLPEYLTEALAIPAVRLEPVAARPQPAALSTAFGAALLDLEAA